jgi:hypothetical protein
MGTLNEKNFKGLSLVLMLCMLCCSMSVFTSALIVQPLWTNINNMSVSITFDGTDGIARGIAKRQTGVTSMEGTVTFYKYVSSQWVYVNQWSGSSTSTSLVITGYFPVSAGYSTKLYSI